MAYNTELPVLDLTPGYEQLIRQKQQEIEDLREDLKEKEKHRKKKWETWKCMHVSLEDLLTLSVSRRTLALDVANDKFRLMITDCFGMFALKDTRDQIYKHELGQIVGTKVLDFPYNLVGHKDTRVAALVRFASGKEALHKLSDVSDNLPTSRDVIVWQKECFANNTLVLSKWTAERKVRETIARINERRPEDEITVNPPPMFGKGSIGRQKIALKNSIALAVKSKNKTMLNDSLAKSRALQLESVKREYDRERLDAIVSEVEKAKASRKQEDSLELARIERSRKLAKLEEMEKQDKVTRSTFVGMNRTFMGGVKSALLYDELNGSTEKKPRMDK